MTEGRTPLPALLALTTELRARGMDHSALIVNGVANALTGQRDPSAVIGDAVDLAAEFSRSGQATYARTLAEGIEALQ